MTWNSNGTKHDVPAKEVVKAASKRIDWLNSHLPAMQEKFDNAETAIIRQEAVKQARRWKRFILVFEAMACTHISTDSERYKRALKRCQKDREKDCWIIREFKSQVKSMKDIIIDAESSPASGRMILTRYQYRKIFTDDYYGDFMNDIERDRAAF